MLMSHNNIIKDAEMYVISDKYCETFDLIVGLIYYIHFIIKVYLLFYELTHGFNYSSSIFTSSLEFRYVLYNHIIAKYKFEY